MQNEFLHIPLKTHAVYSAERESGRAVERAIRAFELSSGQDVDLDSLSLSDRVRVLAVAASALSEKVTARAMQFLRSALQLAETKLGADDPANRSLAVTGNNLAATLSEKQNRTPEETSLMILSAQTGRIYWERAGTWLHVMRAEYRLALTFLAMKDFERARRHADICKTMCFENNAENLDKFFAFEAIGLIETAAGEREELAQALTQAGNYFEQLSDDDKAWCKPILDKLILA